MFSLEIPNYVSVSCDVINQAYYLLHMQMPSFEQSREGGQELQCGGLSQLQGSHCEGEADVQHHQDLPV